MAPDFGGEGRPLTPPLSPPQVDGLERERDFYYNKLRDVEVLLQAQGSAAPELTDSVLKILCVPAPERVCPPPQAHHAHPRRAGTQPRTTWRPRTLPWAERRRRRRRREMRPLLRLKKPGKGPMSSAAVRVAVHWCFQRSRRAVGAQWCAGGCVGRRACGALAAGEARRKRFAALSPAQTMESSSASALRGLGDAGLFADGKPFTQALKLVFTLEPPTRSTGAAGEARESAGAGSHALLAAAAPQPGCDRSRRPP